jgi:hypothetical protein
MRAQECVGEKWSAKYKSSINCANPKGFSQRAHCAGRRKNEDEEVLDELSFKGSPCTKDCSGHRAGYEWSQRKGGVDAASWSRSFTNGAALIKNGF